MFCQGGLYCTSTDSLCASGEVCGEDIDDCTPDNECHNGARCVDALNGYTCECRSGWEGRLCTLDINECLSQPCAHGGVCTDELNGFTCQCTANFGGSTCGEDVNECLTSTPCQNYILCDNTFGGFHCVCLPGSYLLLPSSPFIPWEWWGHATHTQFTLQKGFEWDWLMSIN